MENLPNVVFLNWPGSSDYLPRSDNVGLTEVSCRKYLEDLLASIKRGLELVPRHKARSSSSSALREAQDEDMR